MKTKSQEVAAELAALLAARNPLIWIVTKEEARAEGYIFAAAKAARYIPYTWDCAAGVADADGKSQTIGGQDLGDTFAVIQQRTTPERTELVAERRAWIMRDLLPWLSGPQAMLTVRQIRNLVRDLPTIEQENAQSLIVLSAGGEVPPDLISHAAVIEWPLPDREEIAALLDESVQGQDATKVQAPTNGERDGAISAALGLSGEEAQNCFAKSLVQHKRIEPATVAKEKKRVIAREKVLEWCEPLAGGLDAIGGLENLKTWLLERRLAFSPEARAEGLQSPKGMVIVGITGTGKSYTAKAAATVLTCPLLKMDLGALKSKFVGDSEAQLRRCLRVVEAAGRCVLWIDEIEKSLQGASSGSSDGGTSADQLGYLLSWMQHRPGEAFVIATANDVTQLPPEILRKGRFDEVWWVDLPTVEERAAILLATLYTNRRQDAGVDCVAVAKACEGFTGSEIASLVPEAMFKAFADGKRQIRTDDLVALAGRLVPISKTASDKIAAMRTWAKGKARPAGGTEETKTPEKRVRAIDI